MLKFFNRLEKTRNFVLLIFAVLMVASLVFFYAPTRNTADTSNMLHSTETAAKVSSAYITLGDLARQKDNYSQYSRQSTIPSKTLLDGLIGDRIRRVEAERFGLGASDAEVATLIRGQFKSEDGKPFDQKRYEQFAIEKYGSITAFEQQVRDELSTKKLEAFLTSGVTVSEEELLKDFQRKNTKFDLSYVAVNSAELAQTIKPTDQELQEYFDKNKASYYISVPQKKIRYIFVNTSKIGEKLSISEEDLKAEYEKVPADKKKMGVLGQEIVLRVPKPEFDEQVMEKANQLASDMRKGDPTATVTEEAFAALAKGHSENPATAPSGGKLAGPVKENPNKPDDPYQRLLKMKPGEVTEPINYQGRYYILRRGDDVPKTFEDARKELDISLRNRRAYAVAAELAQKVADEFKQNKDAQKTAGDFAGQANMSVADMVKETAYVKPGDDVLDIGVSPQFEEGIATLENVNDVGEKTPIKNGFAVPMLVDKKEPRDAEFAEVKAQVTEIVKLEKARAQVEEIAKQVAAGSANVGALAGAVAGKNLKVQEQKSFIIGSPLGQGPSASTNEELEDAIYGLKQGDVTKTPLKVGDNWYVVGVTKREDASMDDFAKQRDSLREQMLNQKRSEIFSEYVASTRRKMEADGSIKIYQDVVEKVDGPPAGGLPTGFPGGGVPGGMPGGQIPIQVPPGGDPGGAPNGQ
jgi:peptidyl-prolyl cis-trans isomerase D